MSQAKVISTTGYRKTADAKLFALHDKFCKAYTDVLIAKAKDPDGNGSLPSGTKEEKAAHNEWERAINKAGACARAVIMGPALTLEGMLMKIHVAGFNFSRTEMGTFSAPYHGGICNKDGPQHWRTKSDEDEIALIVSLRSDLERFAGRRM